MLTQQPSTQTVCGEAVRRLDTMNADVTVWEASFLDSLLRDPHPRYTPKRRMVLARMVERYLNDAALAAEVLGQQRLPL